MAKNTILLAILIRLLIIPFFYHPDIKSTLFHTQYLSQGVFDIYTFIDANRQHLPYNNIFVYLPATYLFLGFINILLTPLYPASTHQWLFDWSFFQNNNPALPFILLILKIPYLLFDFAIALLVYKIFKNKKMVTLWLFNPIVLYLVYVQGNFDIIPCFFTMLCWYSLSRKRYSWGFLSLGFGIALKIYPILFLPFFLLKYPPSFKKGILFSLVTFLPLIISAIPFLTHANFYASFLGSGLTQKLLEFKILTFPVFPILYLIILINFYFSQNKVLEKQFLLLFFMFISLVNFHPQWLIWFLPFITPYFFSRSRYLLIFIFILCFCYIFLINDNFLFWAHLTPVDWEFTRATSPYNLVLLKTPINPDTLRNTVKILISLCGLLFLQYEKKSSTNHS